MGVLGQSGGGFFINKFILIFAPFYKPKNYQKDENKIIELDDHRYDGICVCRSFGL